VLKILVTGGAGFIGSHLCEFLASKEGFVVWSIDNYSTGSVANHISNVTYIECDTSDIDKAIKFSPDWVFHLGEYSRVEQSFFDMERVWESNKHGTFKVLQFCLKHKSKLIYAGSSTKFGDGGLGRSQSPYAWTKASNTELVKNFGDWFGLNYVITYFYNAYGPREISTGKYATLIGIYAQRFKEGLPLGVVSPGTQERNFTHVKDIVSGLFLIARNGEGDDFGIGSEESFSILEIARMFGGPIEMLEKRAGNRQTAKLVVSKTEALGWRPSHSVVNYIYELKDQIRRDQNASSDY